MIKGAINRDLEAILRLTLVGAGGVTRNIDVVIDTGFNGFLTLPLAIIDELKWPYLFRQQGELADGSLHVFDVHSGAVRWEGKQRDVEVEVADADPLLGVAMLEEHVLNMDVVAGGAVTIQAHAP